MTAQEQNIGSWTAYHPLDNHEYVVFNEALAGFVGVEYEPQEVAVQVVNGINYLYLCNGSVPDLNILYKVIVSIYAPINGAPHITEIRQL